MRDDENHPEDEGARWHPALRWILILILTAIIVAGGMAMIHRDDGGFLHLRRLIVVWMGAALGIGYLVLTAVLGTRRVEASFEDESSGKPARIIFWFLVAALVVVIVLAILYTA